MESAGKETRIEAAIQKPPQFENETITSKFATAKLDEQKQGPDQLETRGSEDGLEKKEVILAMPSSSQSTTTQDTPTEQSIEATNPTAAQTPAVLDFNSCKKPRYPRGSGRNEETGDVVLTFLVGVDGRVLDAKVDRSSGFSALDEAALDALKICKFTAGESNGKSVQSLTKVVYRWTLE